MRNCDQQIGRKDSGSHPKRNRKKTFKNKDSFKPYLGQHQAWYVPHYRSPGRRRGKGKKKLFGK